MRILAFCKRLLCEMKKGVYVMEQLQNGGWFSPNANDVAVKKDLQKKYGWFSNILYWVLLFVIGVYVLVKAIGDMRLYGTGFFDIIKLIIFSVMVLAGAIGIFDFFKDVVNFKKSVFYVKTCRIAGMRGEKSGKYVIWFLSVEDGNQVVEYECKSNPFFRMRRLPQKERLPLQPSIM